MRGARVEAQSEVNAASQRVPCHSLHRCAHLAEATSEVRRKGMRPAMTSGS